MKQVAFAESPDGSRTSFTLAAPDRPAEAALIFVIDTGVMLEKVTSGASGLQFSYNSGTGVVSTGYAPRSGARFYAYVQTASTKGLRLEEPSGTKNGSNTTFMLTTAPPASTHAVGILGGRVLEPVASSPSGLQYSIASATLTLGVAPQSGDYLAFYVEEDELAGANFQGITFTGSKNGTNKVFDTDLASSAAYTPTLFLMHAGLVLKRKASATLAAGEFYYDDDTQQLTLGVAPASTEALIGYITQYTVRPGVNLSLSAWLANSNYERIIIATFTGKKADGSSKTFRQATKPYATLPSDTPANTEWGGLLIGVPDINQAMQEAFEGRSQKTFGTLTLQNPRSPSNPIVGRLDADFGASGYSLDGQDVTLEILGPGLAYADRGTVLQGVCGVHSCDGDSIQIPISDNTGALAKKTTHATLTTAEYANLPAGAVGKFKPSLYGQVYNFEPTLISTATPLYLLAGHTIDGLDAVRDNGVALVEDLSDPPAAGKYYVNRSASGGATVKLGSTPTGVVTVDMHGHNISGIDSTLGKVIEGVLTGEAGYSSGDFDTGALTIYQAQTPYAVGIIITEPTPIHDVLDQLISGVPTYYTMTREGLFYIARFTTPTEAAVLTLADDIELREPARVSYRSPVWKVSVSYDTLEYTHNDGTLAGAVSLANKERYKTTYRTKQASDSGVLTNYPLATEKLIESRLNSEADAATVASLHLSLFGVRRTVVTAPFDLLPLSLKLGEVVDFSSPRYGLQGKWRVIGIKEQYQGQLASLRKNTVELTLWQ